MSKARACPRTVRVQAGRIQSNPSFKHECVQPPKPSSFPKRITVVSAASQRLQFCSNNNQHADSSKSISNQYQSEYVGLPKLKVVVQDNVPPNILPFISHISLRSFSQIFSALSLRLFFTPKSASTETLEARIITARKIKLCPTS